MDEPSFSGVADDADESKHSRVAFEIEPAADSVCLTVTHDGFEPESAMLATSWRSGPPSCRA